MKILWYCDEKGGEGFAAFICFFYFSHWNGHRLNVKALTRALNLLEAYRNLIPLKCSRKKERVWGVSKTIGQAVMGIHIRLSNQKGVSGSKLTTTFRQNFSCSRLGTCLKENEAFFLLRFSGIISRRWLCKCFTPCFGFESSGIPFRKLLNPLLIAFFALLSAFFSGASKKHNINPFVNKRQKRGCRQNFRSFRYDSAGISTGFSWSSMQ